MTLPPGFTLRPATPADAAAAERMLAAAYGTLLAPDYPADVLAAVVPVIARPRPELLACGTWYLVLAATGEVAAAGGFTPSAPGGGAGEPGTGHVRHVATDPRFLRRGLGRAVLAHAATEAARQGIGTLLCASTLTAAPFYRAAGFRETGAAALPIGGVAFATLAMRRDRAPGGAA